MENDRSIRQIYLTGDKKRARYQIAAGLMKTRSFITLADTREIMMYEGGIYCPGAESLIVNDAQDILGDLLTKADTSEILGHIERTTIIRRKEIDQEKPQLIPLQNGILDIDTGQLQEYGPHRIFFSKLAAKYDPAADCPKIKTFLSPIFS